MPKPLLLHRPSGLHVRFFVPAFLQPSLGRRYIVLSLRGQTGDAARLRAAQIGYVLGQAYERMRGAAVADHKNLLNVALTAAHDPHIELTLELPGGIRITTDGSARENAEASALAMDLERQRLVGSQEVVTVTAPNPEDCSRSASTGSLSTWTARTGARRTFLIPNTPFAFLSRTCDGNVRSTTDSGGQRT